MILKSQKQLLRENGFEGLLARWELYEYDKYGHLREKRTLGASFIWEGTKEGQALWSKVYDCLEMQDLESIKYLRCKLINRW